MTTNKLFRKEIMMLAVFLAAIGYLILHSDILFLIMIGILFLETLNEKICGNGLNGE